jgi:uncharacterized protein YceH (UPF0502 family)
MTDTPMKLVVDLSKPEGEREQYIPLTAEEIAQREADALAYAEEQAARQAEAEAKADAKASAIAKLIALGLTEEEAQAFIS